METIFLSSLFLLMSIFSAVGTNPGIVIRLNNQGLQYGRLIHSLRIILILSEFIILMQI